MSPILASSLPARRVGRRTRPIRLRVLTMKMRSWILMIALPLAMAVSVTSSEAQGKGKAQGTEKGGQGKGQGSGKVEKAPIAAPSSKGRSAVQQRGQSQKVSQGRAGENRSVASDRRRSAEPMKGSTAAKTLPASANAAARASVASAANRGRSVSRFARDLRVSEVRPSARRFVASNRPAEFVTGGAVAYAFARGAPENALLITPAGRDVSVRNRKGDLLLALDDDRARDLGVWQVSPLNDRVKEGSPAFCRSGQGHPVWGRQWCLDKGFGLGADRDVRWGTTRNIGDIILGRQTRSGILTRDALLSLLGPVAFDRLALHALTLGYTDPLTGMWRSEASGPNVLLVNSGSRPIAEFVDTNRDQRSDLMLVALRPW